MNIQQTSKALSINLSDRGISVGCGCFALICGLPVLTAGLYLLWAFNHVKTLKCQRFEPTQVTCTLNSSNFQGQSIKTLQLQGAEVKVDTDSEGSETFQVILLTTQGKVPLNEHYGGLADPRQIAEQINYFVKHPEQSDLSIKQDERLFGYLWGGLWTLFGVGSTLIGVLSIPVGVTGTIWLFDKNLGRLQIILYHGLLLKTQVVAQEWALNEIAQVQVVEEQNSDGSLMHNLSMETKSGESARLPISSSNREEYDKAAEIIHNFLNL